MRAGFVQFQANVRVQILSQLSLRSTVKKLFCQSLIGRWDLLLAIIANDTDKLDDIFTIFTFGMFSILVFVEVERHAQLCLFHLFIRKHYFLNIRLHR